VFALCPYQHCSVPQVSKIDIADRARNAVESEAHDSGTTKIKARADGK
jgi:hypothetical protein